jgi:hypothetical protein
MGDLFGGGGGNSAAQDESLDLQRQEIDRNNMQLQQKVQAFSAQRLNIIKAQGTGSYNDRTINT